MFTITKKFTAGIIIALFSLGAVVSCGKQAAKEEHPAGEHPTDSTEHSSDSTEHPSEHPEHPSDSTNN
ncbi:MAG: hypothetical protein U5K54_09365 [Cytophagales bacterium]|nr:hypothetical protein [Cytophagales bacterium]